MERAALPSRSFQGQGHGAKGERAKDPPAVARGEEAPAECECEWLPSQPVPDPGGRLVTALDGWEVGEGRGGGSCRKQRADGVRGSGSGCVGRWHGGAEGTKATGVIRGRAGGALGGSSQSLQRKKKLGLLLTEGTGNVVYSQQLLRKENAPFSL